MRNNFRNFYNRISGFSFFEKLFLLAPILIWFSYFPNFHFGKSEGANIEFSLPLIFCAFLAIISIFEILKDWKKNKILLNSYAVRLTFLFVFWNFATIFWSGNPLRTFLTAGIWLVLWLIFVRLIVSENIKKMLPILQRNLIVSSIIIAILVVIQVAVGAFSDFGLCHGCVAGGFGFARPSVFAIEPQFLGSLFLAPILILWSNLLKNRFNKKTAGGLFILLMATYLTLSRGAIFALTPAMFMLVFISNSSKSIRTRILAFLSIVIVSFGAGMMWHAIFTELNPRILDGFYDSISKSVNQLSLGKISLPKKTVEKPVEKSVDKIVENAKNDKPQKASFNGYVEKSTDERTRMSDLALETWRNNFRNIFFGVGAGGAGKAIFETTKKTANSAEIVQNEFLSVLLELGVLGVIVFGAIIFGFIRKNLENPLAIAVILAFILQWNFFSGLPNALHIYLILATFFVIIERAYEKKSAINRRIHTAQAKSWGG